MGTGASLELAAERADAFHRQRGVYPAPARRSRPTAVGFAGTELRRRPLPFPTAPQPGGCRTLRPPPGCPALCPVSPWSPLTDTVLTCAESLMTLSFGSGALLGGAGLGPGCGSRGGPYPIQDQAGKGGRGRRREGPCRGLSLVLWGWAEKRRPGAAS